jgi:type I restriction enzyme S subunit
LAEQLKTQKVQRYFKSETRAVAQPTLNIKQLKETEIFIPPMKQQLEFSERLEGVRKHLSLHAHAIQKMEVLNSSLQSQAFQGEL